MSTAVTETVELESFHPIGPVASKEKHALAEVNSDGRSLRSSSGNNDPSPGAEEEQGMSNLVKFRLVSCCLCFATAGVNDSSLGPLIPYLMKHYGISTGFVAIVYIPTFIGWLAAALVNSHAYAFFGMGGVLFIGAAAQLLSNVIRVFAPAYGLYAFSFFLAGIGAALQDSQANTYVSGMKTAHQYLGLIHAMYGVGCTLGPLIATAVASNTNRWNFFYFVMIGLNLPNVVLVGLCFREMLFKRPVLESTAKDEEPQQQESTARKATHAMVASLKNYSMWIISLFFFFYLGAAISIGGWVVEFLVSVRGGDLTAMGYMPIALNGGMSLGRISLPHITYKYGERLMVAIYICICIGWQLVFWLVPNIAANGVALGFLGFFSGPLFGTGISVATKLIPKELHVSAIGLIFVFGQAGGALFPYITGVIAASAGVKVLQPVATGLFAATAVCWLLAPKVDKKEE